MLCYSIKTFDKYLQALYIIHGYTLTLKSVLVEKQINSLQF